MLSGEQLTEQRIAEAVSTLRESLGAGLEDAESEVTYELRYRGQAFELPIEGTSGPARPISSSASRPSTSAATATATPTPPSIW